MTEHHAEENQAITVGYRNYKGEHSMRRIVPKRIHFGATEWHSEPQWLMEAFDLDKNASRDFALLDFDFTPKV